MSLSRFGLLLLRSDLMDRVFVREFEPFIVRVILVTGVRKYRFADSRNYGIAIAFARWRF